MIIVLRRAVLLVLCVFVAAHAAVAQDATAPVPATTTAPVERAVTWGAELDTSTRYIWHGLPYSTGAVVWPSVWLTTRGLTVSLWTVLDPHYDHVKPNRSGELVQLSGPVFNEYDITAAYERDIGKLTVSGTFSRYTYREPAGIPEGSTSEVIARAAYAVGPGQLFTTHSVDVEAHRGGYYADAGYAIERAVHPKATLKIDGSVSVWPAFATHYGFTNYGAMGPATLNVAVVQQLTPKLSLRPHLTFMRLMSGAARREQRTPGVSAGLAVTFGS